MNWFRCNNCGWEHEYVAMVQECGNCGERGRLRIISDIDGEKPKSKIGWCGTTGITDPGDPPDGG
jgi:hypothetical protein